MVQSLRGLGLLALHWDEVCAEAGALMDWSDEHYVKLYSRRTATYCLWPWQARALLGPLLCVLDKSGILDVGTRRPPAESVAALTLLPTEVVAPGLEAMLTDGSLELESGRLVMPKFLEAQEARKTRAAVARDHREKKRDKARAKSAGLLGGTVTESDQREHRVTASDPPSPARPLPVPVPLKTTREKPREPDARWQPTVQRLEQVFKTTTGAAYRFQGSKDGAALKRLLAHSTPDEIVRRWSVGLRGKDWLHTATIAQLDSKWNDLATPAKPGAPIDPLTQGHRTEGPITAEEVQL